jgi:hypothetical protein
MMVPRITRAPSPPDFITERYANISLALGNAVSRARKSLTSFATSRGVIFGSLVAHRTVNVAPPLRNRSSGLAV